MTIRARATTSSTTLTVVTRGARVLAGGTASASMVSDLPPAATEGTPSGTRSTGLGCCQNPQIGGEIVGDLLSVDARTVVGEVHRVGGTNDPFSSTGLLG